MPSPSLRSPADFTYTIGLSNGDMRQVPYDGINTALLRADHDEPAWRCIVCNEQGWSLVRSGICFKCGAPSPEEQLDLSKRKAAKRVQMAERRPAYLGGRRITDPVEGLRSSPRLC